MNQIDMAEPEQVISFCGKVDAKEEGELTILKINDLPGLCRPVPLFIISRFRLGCISTSGYTQKHDKKKNEPVSSHLLLVPVFSLSNPVPPREIGFLYQDIQPFNDNILKFIHAKPVANGVSIS